MLNQAIGNTITDGKMRFVIEITADEAITGTVTGVGVNGDLSVRTEDGKTTSVKANQKITVE